MTSSSAPTTCSPRTKPATTSASASRSFLAMPWLSGVASGNGSTGPAAAAAATAKIKNPTATPYMPANCMDSPLVVRRYYPPVGEQVSSRDSPGRYLPATIKFAFRTHSASPPANTRCSVFPSLLIHFDGNPHDSPASMSHGSATYDVVHGPQGSVAS